MDNAWMLSFLYPESVVDAVRAAALVDGVVQVLTRHSLITLAKVAACDSCAEDASMNCDSINFLTCESLVHTLLKRSVLND